MRATYGQDVRNDPDMQPGPARGRGRGRPNQRGTHFVVSTRNSELNYKKISSTSSAMNWNSPFGEGAPRGGYGDQGRGGWNQRGGGGWNQVGGGWNSGAGGGGWNGGGGGGWRGNDRGGGGGWRGDRGGGRGFHRGGGGSGGLPKSVRISRGIETTQSRQLYIFEKLYKINISGWRSIQCS